MESWPVSLMHVLSVMSVIHPDDGADGAGVRELVGEMGDRNDADIRACVTA